MSCPMAESDRGPSGYTPYHSQFLAHRLTLAGLGQDVFGRSFSAAKAGVNDMEWRHCSPHAPTVGVGESDKSRFDEWLFEA